MSLISMAKQKLKRSFPELAAVYRLHSTLKAGQGPIFLDYPLHPRPRYGWGKAAHGQLHDLIEQRTSDYLSVLADLVLYDRQFASIPIHAGGNATAPHWLNGYIQALDAATLYAFPALSKAKLYIEVGSGNSTKFVRRSIVENGLQTRIVSIDPQPRVQVDGLCDEIIRKPLEMVDMKVFDELRENDILMVDNSHQCFQNSDVTVTFLEILPRLKPGVIIYMDDIYLPYDYPPEWADRYYSEQYLLATLLLADKTARYEILFPGLFVSASDGDLQSAAADFWARCGLTQFSGFLSNGFWLRVRADKA